MTPDDQQRDTESKALVDAVHLELRAGFAQSLPGRVDAIRRIVDTLIGSSHDVQALRDLHAETHRLAGTSAMYGFTQVSDVVRTFNRELIERIRDGATHVHPDVLQSFMTALTEALQAEG